MVTMLAHGGGAPEFASSILVAAGVVAGWVGLSRLRGRGFARVPRSGGIALLALAPLVVVASAVVPSIVWPGSTSGGSRPASTATIGFADPSPGQVVSGDVLSVRLEIEGGTIVVGSSATVTADTGHVHVLLDGELLSMTYGLEQEIGVADLTAGAHRLDAEFVAADHAPFDPPVVTTVTFVKEVT
jgi:hypothetical protein